MQKIDGEIVTNATRPLRVEITKRDIEDGAPLQPNACAIAVACKRHLKDQGVTDAYVHLGRLYLLINKKWKRWHVPGYARDEVVAFDRGGKFVPQEIIFTPPPAEELVKRIKRSRRSPSAPVSKRKRVVHRTPEVRHSAHANLPPTK